MKRGVLILLFILLSSLVSASHSVFVRDSLKEGKAEAYKTDNGIYVVELVLVSGSSAKFKINNEELETLGEGESDKIVDGSQLVVWKILKGEQDEVDYFFYGSGDFPLEVELETTWELDACNFDGTCEEHETKDNCCYDCGCNTGYSCEENLCIRKKECSSNEECKDDNPCSTDLCIDEKCKYTKQLGCIKDNTCHLQGSTTDAEYCSGESWIKRKEPLSQCIENYECLNDKCLKNKCYKKTLKGIFTALFLIILISSLTTGIIYGIKKGLFKKFVKKIKDHLFWRF